MNDRNSLTAHTLTALPLTNIHRNRDDRGPIGHRADEEEATADYRNRHQLIYDFFAPPFPIKEHIAS